MYWQHCRDVGPKLTQVKAPSCLKFSKIFESFLIYNFRIFQSSLRLKEPIENCDVANDIKTIATTKGIEQPVSEQLLPDFYAEHTTLAMNKERRRQVPISRRLFLFYAHLCNS